MLFAAIFAYLLIETSHEWADYNFLGLHCAGDSLISNVDAEG